MIFSGKFSSPGDSLEKVLIAEEEIWGFVADGRLGVFVVEQEVWGLAEEEIRVAEEEIRAVEGGIQLLCCRRDSCC